MGVDHSSLLYAGWALTDEHREKLKEPLRAKELSRLEGEEYGDEIGVLLGCQVVIGGSAYSGDYEYFLSVLPGGGLNESNHVPVPDLEKLAAKFDAVREKAKTFGIKLGPPNFGAVGYVW